MVGVGRYREFMIIGIDHVVLCVRDVEQSVEWYATHLGLEAERLDEWRVGKASFVSLRVNESTLIDLLADPPDGRNVDHVAFVADRAGFDAFVAAHGDEIEMSPYLMRVHVQKNRNRSTPPEDVSTRDQQEADDAAIRHEVDELLSDIRASFLPDMQHLRLYVESKPGSPQEPVSPQEMAGQVEAESPMGRRRVSGN
jgi:catechol 2,3-dioxygenase-like lactoylglutathione lyase family enzyme